MYDYGSSGLRTRVNPVTGEVEYDDTPSAPGGEAMGSTPALRPVMPEASLSVAAQPSVPPDEDVRVLNSAAQPYMEHTGRADARSLAQPAPKLAPQIPDAIPQGEHALYTDPHEQAVFDTEPEHKRNIFSKILAGLAGAYYGSQGRIDLAEQIGQQPHTQWEGNVAKREGEINTQRKQLQDQRDQDLKNRYVESQITENNAQAARAGRTPVLEPRYSTGEGTATMFDPNTGKLTYQRDPNAPEPRGNDVNWQTIQTENGWEQVNPQTGERRSLGARPPAKQMTERQPTQMDVNAWLGTGEGRAAYQRAYLDEQQQVARQLGFETLDELQAAQSDPDRGDAVRAALKGADARAQRRAMQEASGAVQNHQPPPDFLQQAARKYGQGSEKYNRAVQIWQQQHQ